MDDDKTSKASSAGLSIDGLGGNFCPVCGGEEVDALTPFTVYACGSRDYDGRPGTFLRGAQCIAGLGVWLLRREGFDMKKESIKAWVTKYALSGGIVLVDGDVCHEISSGMLSYGEYGTAHGKDWHRTPEAALARAEEMRKKKIASLRKSIEKLEMLKFEAPNAKVTGSRTLSASPVE